MYKNKKAFVTFILAVCVSFSSLSATAQACPGCVDPTFGTGGKAIFAAVGGGGIGLRAVMQQDGKVLSLASGMIVRFNADGSLDTTFDGDGFLPISWPGPGTVNGTPYAIAVQSVGVEQRIIVAGVGLTGTARKQLQVLRVQRYLPDGALDSSFASGGTANISAGYALAVTVQAVDNKILTVGDTGDLVRLNSNGTLDTTFGVNGIVNAGGVVSSPGALTLQVDGRVLVAGSYKISNKITGFGIARFNANGSLDNGSLNDSTPGDSFGTAGRATAQFAGRPYAAARSVTLDLIGRVVAVGSCYDPNNFTPTKDFAIARFSPSGLIDNSFNGNGKATLDYNGSIDDSYSVAIQSNGQILIGGDGIYSPGNLDFVAARYNPDGSLDSTFGAGGIVGTDFFGSMDSSKAILIQIDPACMCEKIVMAGRAAAPGVNYAAAVRFTQ